MVNSNPFWSLFYPTGTQHGTLHQSPVRLWRRVGWPILFCSPTEEPALATTYTGNSTVFFSSLNEGEWTRKVELKRNHWQQAKHEGLYSDPLQALKGEPLSSGLSTDGSLNSASTVPPCGAIYGDFKTERTNKAERNKTRRKRVRKRRVNWENLWSEIQFETTIETEENR